ncbi:Ig-like domain-containing protein, partial [Thermodesulfobacteriota bacterium]
DDDTDGDGKIDPAGFEVRTGTATDPIYIDLDGNQRIAASADRVLLQLSEFVHVVGSFSFEKGPKVLANVATGLPSDIIEAVEALGNLISPEVGDALKAMGSTIPNLEMNTLQIGASGVSAFVGLNGPYWADDLDGDGEISWAFNTGDGTVVTLSENDEPVKANGLTYGDINNDGIVDANETQELSEDAVGLAVTDLDVGFVTMAPTIADFVALFEIEEESLKGIIPKFTALKATADSVGFVGLDEAQFSLEGITINYNNGTEWIGGLGPPVVDFLNSFPAEANGVDVDEDGKTGEPAGFEVGTGGDPVYIDFDGNQRIGATVGKATLQISEFVHVTGSFAFEMGPVQTVDVTGGLLSGLTSEAITLLETLGLPTSDFSFNIPAGGATSTELSFMTIGASNVHAFVGLDGPYWDDANGNTVMDAGEINENAIGLVINDFDFGLAIMTPTNPLDFAKYFALRATAEQVALVGVEGVTLEATKLLVEVNQSSPSIYGLPLFPVIDFANTPQFASEQLTLFDTSDDGVITLGELATLNSNNCAGIELLLSVDLTDSTPVDHEALLEILNTNDTGDSRGVIDIDEAAALLGGNEEATAEATSADIDGDGKIDPQGYEVLTGGEPVYLTMDSSLIRAQGFMELNIFDALYLTGSIAFELGPTQEVTLTDSTTKEVTTMTIGGANVTAFIGANGPYWTDTNGDHSVNSNELNPNAIGFHITDLDVGIMIMASVNPLDLGVYLAAKASVESFGVVGIDALEATGRFDIAMNVGIGLGSGAAVVDFVASFNEQLDLFDTDDDGTITVGELRVLHGDLATNTTSFSTTVGELYAATALETDVVNLDRVVEVLDTDMDGILTVTEAAVLATTGTAALETDADGDGNLDFGLKVNTGDPTSPVVLGFDQFLISFQLGGIVTIYDGPKSEETSKKVVELNGVLLFEVNNTGLTAFVAAGLEFGPDIEADSDNKLFDMNALGGLVINGDGIAADIEVSVSVGGALSNVLALNASARLMFNTTSEDQTITIPELYAVFLDGSTTFTISGGAPRLDAPGNFEDPGPYFLVSLQGRLTIASAFVIAANFHLKISGAGLELGFDGEIDLGGFASLDVEGGAVIEDGVFAAYVGLKVNIDVAGIKIEGDAVLEINTSGTEKTVLDALGDKHEISGNTYKVSVAADIDLFGVLEAAGSVEIGVENGDFLIDVNATLDFFSILDVGISGYINTNGSFSFTGNLELDLTYAGFGIRGDLAVTLSNSGFSGHGSVGLVVAGIDINIASAELSVDWEAPASFKIRAEGPLGIWVEVTSSSIEPYFSIDGGLGDFGAIFDAIGDAADAAVAEASEAVANAVQDLGEAILDFGSDVIDFFDGLFTDIDDLVSDVIGAISSLFDDSKTVVYDKTDDIDPFDYYSYSASQSGGILTINNSSASKLCLAVVNGKLVVDAPDVTKSVVVAKKVHYTRDWEWWPPGWSSWSQHCSSNIKRNVTFSNMSSFQASDINEIVIHGSEDSETIILDRNSIGIPTEVYGNGGDDIIVTGTGDDYVEGGNGNDTIFTYEGNDELYGDAGNDKLMGGTGNDELYGGSGNDLLDESYDRAAPNTIIPETNTLSGGSGEDQILGSPGKDTIEGGSENDLLMGLYHDDTYIFNDNYGTDTLVDYYGKEILDFSEAENALDIAMSAKGITASTDTGDFLSIDPYVWIAQLTIGTGDDDLTSTTLPDHQIDIIDGGGSDTYDFNFQTVTAQDVCRVSIVDTEGTDDNLIFTYTDGQDEINEPSAPSYDTVGVQGKGWVTYTGIDELVLNPLGNVAPTVVLNSVAAIDENGTATLTGTITDPDTQDTITLTVNWCDGNTDTYTYAAGTTIFSETHQYLDDNPTGTVSDTYTISVKVTDNEMGAGSDTGTVTVNNVAPTVSNVSITPEIDRGDSATLTGTITDPGMQDTFVLVIDWGDSVLQSFDLGTTVLTKAEDGIDWNPNTRQLSVDHQYLDDNPTGTSSYVYRIEMTVTDDDGGVGITDPLAGLPWAASGPGVKPASFPAAGIVQFEYDNTPSSYYWETWTFSATAAATGSAAFDWEYLWHHSWYKSYARATAYADGPDGRTWITLYDGSGGEGTETGSANLALHEGYDVGFQMKGKHNDSSRIMEGTLSVMTEPGVSVTVHNVAPTVVLEPVAPICENGAATLIGTITAPGTQDTLTLTVDWGDPFSPDDTQSFTLGTMALTKAADGIEWNPETQHLSVDHQYMDDNPMDASGDTYTILVTVTDGNYDGSDTETVLVNNVAPILSNVSIAPEIDEGDFATLTGTIIDPGAQDTFTLTIDWGDGDTITYTYGAGTTSFNETHQYIDDAPTDTPSDVYRIGMTVTDDDGGVFSTDPFTGLSWTTSGPGATSATSPAAGLMEFAYDNTPSSYDWETWTFSATAATTGSVAFDWDYLRHHSWYQSYAIAKAYADSPSGRTWVTLYDGWGGNCTDTGSASLEIYEGYGIGFQTEGKHYDSSRIMQGTLSVMTGPSVSVTVNNVAPTVVLGPVVPIDENGIATLAGNILDPARVNPVTNLTTVDEMIEGTQLSTTAADKIDQADIKDNAHGRWSYNNAVPGGGGDDYAIVGTGTLQVNTAGVFSFAISGDDGGRLRIDGKDVIVDENLHPFQDKFGVATLDSGTHTFEWVGFERSGGAGWEFSVAVGTNSEPVNSSNGWKVVGDPEPHSEISLNGQIDVTVYYASTETFTLTVDWGEGSPEVFELGRNKSFSVTHQYLDDSPTGTTSDVYRIGMTVTDDDGGVCSNDPFAGLSWTTSGPGSTSASSPAAGIMQFTYDNTPSSYTWETWTFSATAETTRSVAFDWEYLRHHSWWQSYAMAMAYADSPIGRTWVTIYDGSGGVSTDTGSASLELYEGYGFGFQTKGKHYDYSRIMQGTLSVMTGPSVSVTVNNVAPTVDAGADQTVDEGSYFTSSGSFSDPGADTWTGTVNYGDGTGAQIITLNTDNTFDLSHVYADNGVYTVTLAVADDDGGIGTDTATVTVNNIASTVDAGADQTVDEGSVVSLAPATFNDFGTLDTHTVWINWGDLTGLEMGSVSETPFGPPGDTAGMDGTVDASHVYADSGIYNVTVTVTDDDGATTSDSLLVTVNNVAPTGTLTNNGPVNEGSPATVTFGGQSDPSGADTAAGFIYSYDFDNDGTFDVVGSSSASAEVPASFLDDGPGTLTVRGRIADKDGGFTDLTTTIDILNVAPTVSNVSVTPEIDEGDSVTLTGTITDPGTQDTFTLTVDWGDGNTDTYEYGAGPISFRETHQYLDDKFSGSPSDVYRIGMTVTDDDGGVANRGPLAGFSWTKSGPGVISTSSPAEGLMQFTYENPSYEPLSWETWTFSATAETTRSVAFDWEYLRHHCWWNSRAIARAYADGPDGETWITLYDGFGGEGTDTGSASMELYEGYEFGFQTEGMHNDSSLTMRGTLSVLTGPVVIVKNVAPFAGDDIAVTDEDHSISLAILSNDSDVGKNDVLSVTDVDSGSTTGLVSLVGDTVTYDPDGKFEYLAVGETATDTFTYTVTDGDGGFGTATVTLTVTGVNDAPVAVDDNYTTDEDTTLVIAVPGILGNDSDADGDALIASPVSGLLHGSAVVGADGSISYTPDADFHGTDSFTYVANDGTVDSNIATVTITVDSVNDAPVTSDLTVTTDEDTNVSGQLIATDIDGDTLIFFPTDSLSMGSMVLNANGSFTYWPDA